PRHPATAPPDTSGQAGLSRPRSRRPDLAASRQLTGQPPAPPGRSAPGLVEEYASTTGAVLEDRDGWDAFPDASAITAAPRQGPVLVLTHPEATSSVASPTARR